MVTLLPSRFPPADAAQAAAVEAAMRRWLERAVIGLNLCPFAKAVYVKDQVRIVVTGAGTTAELLEELAQELTLLDQADPALIDTTLLIHPQVLGDFLDFNDFLDDAERLLEGLELEGVLQVASFHPQYQFAGTAADDMGNFSNRAPFPTLHLLREDSLDKAIEAFPDPEAIFGANIRRLEALGPAGWDQLFKD
ncbi:MAG: hypothetical protein RL026_2512 [Pseudomonadota bacterium]